jgi:hypothetical protein
MPETTKRKRTAKAPKKEHMVHFMADDLLLSAIKTHARDHEEGSLSAACRKLIRKGLDAVKAEEVGRG